MPTREEIKKFISLYLKQRFIVDELPGDECDTEVEFIFQYLHSQGVVRKVDRELPDNPYKRRPRIDGYDLDYNPNSDMAGFFTQQAMLEAGYAAVEPLIEVNDDKP